MQDKSKFIIFISLIIIAGLLLTTINFPVEKIEHYGVTGVTADTTSKYEVYKKGYNYRNNNIWIQGRTPPNEIFVRPNYVVSWQSQTGKSQLITTRADFAFDTCGAWTGFNNGCGYLYSVALQYYYVKVDYTDTSGTVTTIIDTKENTFDYDYIELARVFGTAYHDGQGYEWPNSHYLDSIIHTGFTGTPHTCGDSGEVRNWLPGKGGTAIQSETLEFYMKGPHAGKLTIKYYANKVFISEEKDNLWGFDCNCDSCSYHTKTDVLLASDECYLSSGEGSINILSTNAIPNSGTTEKVEHSDEKIAETYTKYVYEEGQTVRISVDTGYSGQSLGANDIGPDGNKGAGKGWFLNIYGPTGVMLDTQPLDDNLRGKIVDYKIPTGSFVVGSENEFRVVLANTLFDQAETRLFVVKSLASIPGRPLVKTYDEEGHETTKFTQGDRVTVRAEAVANSKGTGDIKYFWTEVKYQSASGVKYAFGPSNIVAIKTGDKTYYCVFSFQLSSDIINVGDVYIRIHAVDSWGQKGPEYEGNIFSEQLIGAYRITILTLTDGTPVSGATCVFTKADGTKTTRISSSEGKALFGLDGGMWDLKVTKDGYYDAEIKDIQVKDDGTYPVNLKPKWFGVDYSLLIIIVIIIAAGIGLVLYQANKKGKINLGKYFKKKVKR